MTEYRAWRQPIIRAAAFVLVVLASFGMTAQLAALRAQDADSPSSQAPPTAIDDSAPPTDGVGETTDGDDATAAAPQVEGINIVSLIFRGGILMLPIALMSMLVVAVTVERFIALRKSRILPNELVAALGKLGGPGGGFDPREAYRICQQYPSSAATVIRAMLLKVGRPHSEVEHTVGEASEREAERMYSNVRWLTLAAGVTPLLGLLGTVWGMIRAFHDTTQLLPGQNKADYLAEGIYVALVTTLAGLSVAIPAAIFAHVFEGRIQTLFHQIDELLFNLLPQIERFEGRVRFSRQAGETDPAAPPLAAATADK